MIRYMGYLLLATVTPASLLAADCVPTPHRTTGTHYAPVTDRRDDVGAGVVVTGRILAAPGCVPVPGARIDHWQAGESGRYTDALRAWLVSDAEGRFRFETEWPNLNPPHVHFIVTVEGYKKLETQWIGGDRTRAIAFDMVLQPD